MLNDSVCISYHGPVVNIFISWSYMSVSDLLDGTWVQTQVCSPHGWRGEGWKESTVPVPSRSANQKKKRMGLVETVTFNTHTTQEREVAPRNQSLALSHLKGKFMGGGANSAILIPKRK